MKIHKKEGLLSSHSDCILNAPKQLWSVIIENNRTPRDPGETRTILLATIRTLYIALKNNLTITQMTLAGQKYHNQTDYILIQSIWRSSVKDAKKYPGDYCNSDHQFSSCRPKVKIKKNPITEKHPQQIAS